MNKSRSFAEKYEYLTANPPIVNAEYIRGFVDGEGHLAVEINTQVTRSAPTIACSLQVAQAAHDVLLLNAIRGFFKGTRLKPSFDITSLIETQAVPNVVRL